MMQSRPYDSDSDETVTVVRQLQVQLRLVLIHESRVSELEVTLSLGPENTLT
jgi:hypothetical protein